MRSQLVDGDHRLVVILSLLDGIGFNDKEVGAVLSSELLVSQDEDRYYL